MAIIEPEVSRAASEFFAAFRDGWRRDPDLMIDEWADRYRILSRETSAQHGQWRTDRTPYVREVLREMSPSSPTRRVVLMWGAQLGKTESILNCIGYGIHHRPGPIMMVQPTVDVAMNVSKERIVPLVQNTPELSERVLENRSRDGNNTILTKRFFGGFLKIAGANSAAGLRSTPIRDLYPDEVDAYPRDVDGEGDPLELARKRQSNFSRGKELTTGTPTEKDFSVIEREYLRGDQRKYVVPCPHCGNEDWLRWANIDYRDDDPTTANLLCTACGVLIEERHKKQMLERGHWIPTAPGDGITKSYHLSSLYSPLGWLSWVQLVREWLDAKKDPSKLKVFVNTRLAETWEERAESIEPDVVFARRETYAAEVPAGVAVLVASVDVHGDRLEYAIKGFGAGEESWLIAWKDIPFAAPADAKDSKRWDAWLELDRELLEPWEHESGKKLRVECVAVDSGFKSDDVYRFCKARAHRKVFAVKGSNETGKPLVGRPTKNNAFRTRLYMLCTDAGKTTVHDRLKIGAPGIGYLHLPSWIDREYVDQLTAEKVIRRYQRGKPPVRLWVKTRERNEAFDLEVYALAALRILLGPQSDRALRIRAGRLEVKKGGGGVPPAPEVGATSSPVDLKPSLPSPARPQRPWLPRPRKGWVQGWRR